MDSFGTYEIEETFNKFDSIEGKSNRRASFYILPRSYNASKKADEVDDICEVLKNIEINNCEDVPNNCEGVPNNCEDVPNNCVDVPNNCEEEDVGKRKLRTRKQVNYENCVEPPKCSSIRMIDKIENYKRVIKKSSRKVPREDIEMIPQGTPNYKLKFNNIKKRKTIELFTLYNNTVFDNLLPTNLKFTWNKRMVANAGYAYIVHDKGERSSKVELAEKLVDTVDRLCETLIHELCHVAAWLIDAHDGHGEPWKKWATKANKMHPELPPITQCHQYAISYKYTFMCDGCGVTVGRHTKSLCGHICSICRGKAILIYEIVNF